ncbi:UNVERIFIED_CONTAM: hypothetical protein Sradi_1789400 [Sesamum radiatum]|uniref:Uncharacterized protein n=1 Tax=Sesamum radiatum TaxID=300843 RepID=A0AAW2TU90_SESRA
MDLSQDPENKTDPSRLSANAFTADLCFSNVAISPYFFPSFFQALILLSAEPVYINPSLDITTALIASS